MNRIIGCVGLLLVVVAASVSVGRQPPLELVVQSRDESGRPIHEPLELRPQRTAVVVVDMWDRHWCDTYTKRVGALTPRMNQTLDALRALGIQVVFAPSDVMEFYQDAPQRQAMLAIPEGPAVEPVAFDPPPVPGPTDFCECGAERPCRNAGVWTRQHPALTIEPDDLIVDCNNARELLKLTSSRDIDTLLYMGVASNMCVLHRSCGMINIRRHGLKPVMVADLVQAITSNGLGPNGQADFNRTPAGGTARVQRHIEQHVAPTIESRRLIEAAGLAPHASDPRPHVVFVIGEQEYDSERTLPEFARRCLDDYRCTFLFAKGDSGADRNDIPGLEALSDADLLVLSMRRRALPVVQMDHLERYLRAGKPLVAIRVSIVPFQVRPMPPPLGHVVWDRFDREVLGCNYQGYDAGSRQAGCLVRLAPGADEHPILADLEVAEFASPSWLYKQRPLAENAVPLLVGRWSDDVAEEPVAWTNSYRGGRVFYTTLGHPDDFRLAPFRGLLVGAIRWTLSE